ncbi:MAG: hypothetical protein ACRYGO_08815 [Janthinobacterium lividum]
MATCASLFWKSFQKRALLLVLAAQQGILPLLGLEPEVRQQTFDALGVAGLVDRGVVGAERVVHLRHAEKSGAGDDQGDDGKTDGELTAEFHVLSRKIGIRKSMRSAWPVYALSYLSGKVNT